MAYRIHDCVERGEIDNRQKGIVQGKVWLHGRSEPLVLKLQGNAWPDLAGCLLTFTNSKPNPEAWQIEGLATLQEGTIGDLTASRKVRVFDIPLAEAMEMIKRKEKPPEHLANCLYLEWYSDCNGRVVVESVDYQVNISAPEWRLTSEEETQRAEQAAQGMTEFMSRLTRAIEEQKHSGKDSEEPWDEFDYEKFLRESDARTRKYGELLDKYGDSESAEEKIAEAMGWNKELTEEEAEKRREWIEEANEACEQALNEPEPEPDPHLEGIDWVRTEEGHVVHPLQHRALESSVRFSKALEALNPKGGDDDGVANFLFEFQVTAAKLAGALGTTARGVCMPEAAFTVACLKRALGHLHASQAELEVAAGRKVLPDEFVTGARKELFEVREAILQLMDKYRRQT